MQEPSYGAGAGPLLQFTGLLVAVGGGHVDADLLGELASSGGHIVGADGGGDAIAAAGLVPEAIIGDLDSLRDPGGWPAATRIVRLPEQDTTDFEKVLYSTRAPVTVALGMTGGRFDHTLAALDAVARHAAERHLILVDETDIAVALAAPFAFSVAPGDRVSIHPLGPVEFAHSDGLRYPLDGLTLAPGVRTGTSNMAATGPFAIMPLADQAPWLLIVSRSYLLPMIYTLMGGQPEGARST